MNKNLKIAIVGGGIGGLTMALTLQNLGFHFEIFEKASEFTEIGAGVGLSSNAIKIYDKLLIGHEIRNNSYLIKQTIIGTEKLKTLKKMQFPEEVYCIHRFTLVKILAEKIKKENCHFNSELIDIQQDQNQIDLVFKNGLQKRFDLVIAADGIHSVIRKHTFPNLVKRNANQMIWRGITDFDIKKSYEHTYFELLGDSMRFLFLPIQKNQIFWLAIQDRENFNKKSTDLKTHLLKSLESYEPNLLKMIQMTKEEDIIQTELADIQPHSQKWHQGNLVFIGDSIHATTPNLAQGACQAIEDAYTLGLCLNQMSVPEAFEKYYLLRKDKVQFIVNLSWQLGKYSLVTSNLQKFITQNILKWTPLFIYENRYKKLINIDYLKDLESKE